MSFELIPTPHFEKEVKRLAKKYPSIKSDLATLAEDLLADPIQGDEIFKNCYKIRFAIKSKGRGKRGGGRLITCVKIEGKKIFFLSVYDKSEQESISDIDLKFLLRDLF